MPAIERMSGHTGYNGVLLHAEESDLAGESGDGRSI